MKFSLASLALVMGLIATSEVFAETPETAPAGSTGLCKDGSYTTNDTKKGACAGHKGVKDWYGSSPVPATTNTSAMAPVPAVAASPTPAAASAKTMPATAKTAAATSSTPATGGGPGQVWVNSSSKTYHCPGTKYYGKTKQGEYMTEPAAKAAGNHADHGKSCSS